jgi:sigma-54 dependent transcriptional regulator, acetoin dehydrogenase operon transcriptional activator AcoR
LTIDKILSNRNNLERILDNLKEGIIAHDPRRTIFFFNQEAERITGFCREDVLGKDCHEALGAPFCGEHCSFCGPEPNLDDRIEYSHNILTKDKDLKTIDMSITKMYDENGDYFGVLACFRDVTELLDLKIRKGEFTRFANIVGQDRKMHQLFTQIKEVAAFDIPVHIFGETGTGKELVAAAIHNLSTRSSGPFVPINCGALPEELIETELFGHIKGAFSGAIRDKKGRFELADNGTVFLDEVAELSKKMQVKILRFLQEKTFEKVGGEKTIGVNVRIISATNKDLKKEVLQNKFREDLYFRLNVIPINLPPIRERRSDIPLLIDHFLQQASEMKGGKTLRFSREALPLMMTYRWPGNVRELENAIQYAMVKCGGDIIRPDDLPPEIIAGPASCSRPGPEKKLTRSMVQSALNATDGNKAKAARELGVGRATLYRYLKKHS